MFSFFEECCTFQETLKKTMFDETMRLIPPSHPTQIFHDVAYKAKDRSDLLAGIDEFLDQVTVLPPGEWDPSIRIEPPKSVPSQVHANTHTHTHTHTHT